MNLESLKTPSCHWIYLWPQGAVPPGFNPLRRGWVYRPAPEAPLLRGMPTGSEAFLEMPGACGLRPCAWPHPKKALCHTRPVGGTDDKYPPSPSKINKTRKMSSFH